MRRDLVPAGLQAYAARGPEWTSWLDGLPATAGALLDEWALRPDGASMFGQTALVVPVRTEAGERAVLKLVWPHREAEHEALALQKWGGDGAVRLLRADPHRWALLLERLDTRDLTTVDPGDACEIVGSRYARLHRPAPPQLLTLSRALTDWWIPGLAAPPAAVPRRMVEHAASLARDLAGDDDTDGALVHSDLHFENVLAGDREPWLVIDPKPLSGDPHYEPAPMLWNRWGEYDGRVRAGVRDRFFTLVDTAGLDEDRARDWVILRTVLAAVWEVAGNGRPDRDWVTMLVSIAKAVQ